MNRFAFALLLAGCSNDTPQLTLHREGMKDVTMTGTERTCSPKTRKARRRNRFGEGEGFTATDASGAKVRGVVCCPVFDNCTIELKK